MTSTSTDCRHLIKYARNLSKNTRFPVFKHAYPQVTKDIAPFTFESVHKELILSVKGDELAPRTGPYYYTGEWYESNQAHPHFHYVLYDTLFWDSRVYNEDYSYPSVFEDIEKNLPSLHQHLTIAGRKGHNTYSLPPEVSRNIIGGNKIYEDAKVDPFTVNMRNAKATIRGKASITNSTISNVSSEADFKMPRGRASSDYRINIGGDIEIKDSTIYHGTQIEASGIIAGSTIDSFWHYDKYEEYPKLTLDVTDSTLKNIVTDNYDEENFPRQAIKVIAKDATIDGGSIKGSSFLSVEGASCIGIEVWNSSVSILTPGVALSSTSFYDGSSFTLSGDFSSFCTSFDGAGVIDIESDDHWLPGDNAWGEGRKMATFNLLYTVPYLASAIFNQPIEEIEAQFLVDGEIDTYNYSKVLEKSISGTLRAARSVMQSDATVNRFCVAPDAHIYDDCKCALYYPLLLEGDTVGILYFLKVANLEEHIPLPYKYLSFTQLRDMMTSVVNERTDVSWDGNWWELSSEYSKKISMQTLNDTIRTPQDVRDAVTRFCGLTDFSKLVGHATDNFKFSNLNE